MQSSQNANKPKIEEIVANTIYELKQKYIETKITSATIHLVIKEVIEIAEQFSCPGSEKKEHAIIIIKALVSDLVDDTEEKRIIIEFIDKKILENTIDLIISATKGEFNINKKKTQQKLASCIKTAIPIIIDTIIRIINASTKKTPKTPKTSKTSKTDNVIIILPTDESSNHSDDVAS